MTVKEVEIMTKIKFITQPMKFPESDRYDVSGGDECTDASSVRYHCD
jgi:hypothetical protein